MSIPPFTTAPASLRSIAGLNQAIKNDGYYLLATDAPNLGAYASLTPTGAVTGAVLGITGRKGHLAVFATETVKLVFVNAYGTGLLGEQVGDGTIVIQSSLEKLSTTSIDAQDTVTTPVFFNGKRQVELAPGAQVTSDPIPFTLIRNQRFFVRSYCSPKGANINMVVSQARNLGGTANESVNLGDGVIDGNLVDSGTITIDSGLSTIEPLAILGQSSSRKKGVMLLGDSIMASTDDGGYRQKAGGFGARITNQTFSLAYDGAPTSSYCGSIFVAKGSESANNFLRDSLNSPLRSALAPLASTILCNYGTNDLGGDARTLTQLQADTVTITSRFASMGIKVIWFTILPRTTSTDGWITATNQTPSLAGAAEGYRTGFNDWLRAGGLNTATGFSTALVDYYDAAAVVEVNSSGVLTTNGGRWLPPTDTPVTGAINSATQLTTSGFRSNVTMTTNQYRGYTILMTGAGVTSGQATSIRFTVSTNGRFSFSALSTTPGSTDTFSVYRTLPTVDGIHPSSFSHAAIATAFPVSKIV